MATDQYQRELGQRLRAIRQQQDLTLQQVEERSDRRWKAVVIGSYERGDRALSVAKLAELARFYGVPVAELLPGRAAHQTAETQVTGLTVDLTRLQRVAADDDAIVRYVSTIQLRRGDYNGRMLTLRTDDVRALASVLGTDPRGLVDHLTTVGLLAQPAVDGA